MSEAPGNDSTTHQVARGTVNLLCGMAGGKALDFGLYVILARGLQVEQYGRHMYALSFTLLFSIVADLGVGTVFARDSSQDPESSRALLRTTLGLKVLLAIATGVAAVGVAFATGASPATIALVALFTLGMLINQVAGLFETLLRNENRAGVAGLSMVAQSLIALTLGGFLLALGAGVFSGALAYLCGAVVHLLTAANWSRQHWRYEHADTAPERFPMPRFPSLTASTTLIRNAAPLALTGVFLTLFFRADTVILNAVRGPEAVGLYGSVFRFFEALVLVSVAYRSVLFPFMARQADRPVEALRVLCRKSFRVHLIFTVGVAVIVSSQAQVIVNLVLGARYASAAPVLAILVWALPAVFMTDTLLHLLLAQHRQAASARSIALAAAANVALNLVLIPRWGIAGAGMALVGSQVLCFGLMFSEFRRTVPGVGLAYAIRAPLLAGGTAALAMSALGPVSPDGMTGMVISGCIGGVVYLAALALLGALGREDAELMQDLLPSALRPERQQEPA